MHGLLTRTPGRRRLRARHRQRRGRGRLPPPDPPRILPRELSRRSAAPVLARGRHRGVAAAGAGGDRGHRARPRARGARPATVAPRGARPDLALALRAGGRRPIDGADGGGAGPVESGAAGCSASATRCRRRRCARYRVASARARRAGARERRPGGDSVRDAVRARRARRAGSGGDAADARRCRPRCWPSAWARPAGSTVVFPDRTSAPFRVPAAIMVPLELRVVGALTPAIADRAVVGLGRRTDRRAGRDREPHRWDRCRCGACAGRRRRADERSHASLRLGFSAADRPGRRRARGRPLGLEAVGACCGIRSRSRTPRRWPISAASRVASARRGRARGRAAAARRGDDAARRGAARLCWRSGTRSWAARDRGAPIASPMRRWSWRRSGRR